MEWDHFVVIGIALAVLYKHRDELRNGFRGLGRFLKERRALRRKREWSIPRTLMVVVIVVIVYRFVTPYVITEFGILGIAGFIAACWLVATVIDRRRV